MMMGTIGKYGGGGGGGGGGGEASEEVVWAAEAADVAGFVAGFAHG